MGENLLIEEMLSFACWLKTVMIQNTKNSSLLLLSKTKSHLSLFHLELTSENGLVNANTKKVMEKIRILVRPERLRVAAPFALETMVKIAMQRQLPLRCINCWILTHLICQKTLN